MRAAGFSIDTNSATGGSTRDLLNTPGPITFPTPTIWLPGEGFNVDPGDDKVKRDTMNFGRRGNTVGRPFKAAPTITGNSLAFPPLLKTVTARAVGKLGTPTGTAPAPITTSATPAQSGVLPSLNFKLIREEQTDDVSGVWINTWEVNFVNDGEGTFTFGGMGLYHEPSTTTGSPPVANYSGYEDTFDIRTVKVYNGPTGTDLIDCVSAVKIGFNNGLIDDWRARSCSGKNLVSKMDGGKRYTLWYPNRNRLGPQTMTISLDFGGPQPGVELDKLFAVADKLVIEATAGPAGTTPASDELIRFTFGKAAITGGGADPLKKDGEQYSSYDLEGGIDVADGKDLTVEYVGAAAVTFA